MRILLAPFTWLGRVVLWLLFWPLGLWRSIRHGRKRDQAQLVRAIREGRR